MTWQLIARHKHWVLGATISELYNLETHGRRYVATIDGWRNWKIAAYTADQMRVTPQHARVAAVIKQVSAIQIRIKAEDQTVFIEDGAW